MKVCEWIAKPTNKAIFVFVILAIITVALITVLLCAGNKSDVGIANVCWDDSTAIYDKNNCEETPILWMHTPLDVLVINQSEEVTERAYGIVNRAINEINRDVDFQLLNIGDKGDIRVFWGSAIELNPNAYRTSYGGYLHKMLGDRMVADIYIGDIVDSGSAYIVLRQLLYSVIGLGADDFKLSIMYQPIEIQMGTINKQILTDSDRAIIRALYIDKNNNVIVDG